MTRRRFRPALDALEGRLPLDGAGYDMDPGDPSAVADFAGLDAADWVADEWPPPDDPPEPADPGPDPFGPATPPIEPDFPPFDGDDPAGVPLPPAPVGPAGPAC